MLANTIEHHDMRGALWALILALIALMMLPLPESSGQSGAASGPILGQADSLP